MIEFISSWAEQVIIAVIIGTIIEMILPKGNSKKYIKTVIGIYILYTIISPVITLAVGNDFKIDYSEYEKYFTKSEEYKSLENGFNEATAKSIENTYKEEIKNQIKKDIEELGFYVSNISLDINLQTGKITSLHIFVNNKEEKLTYSNTISVEKIQIGSAKEEARENNLSRQEIERIKEGLTQNYGIDYEEIRINSI